MKNLQIKGFTLVELMIVVAIIGILAAIAVPNYQKYQSKARQSEAKLVLGGAFTALQSFIIENSSYTSCLGQIGVGVSGSKSFYTFGFTSNAMPSYSGTTCTGTAGTFYFPGTAGANGGPILNSAPTNGTVITASTFTLGAQGNVNGKATAAGAGSDDWTMDHNKALVNTVPAL